MEIKTGTNSLIFLTEAILWQSEGLNADILPCGHIPHGLNGCCCVWR